MLKIAQGLAMTDSLLVLLAFKSWLYVRSRPHFSLLIMAEHVITLGQAFSKISVGVNSLLDISRSFTSPGIANVLAGLPKLDDILERVSGLYYNNKGELTGLSSVPRKMLTRAFLPRNG